MKIEDVNKAVELKDRIEQTTGEINRLRRRKACDGQLWIGDSESDDCIYVPDGAIDKVLDLIIRAKDNQVKEWMKDLKSL